MKLKFNLLRKHKFIGVTVASLIVLFFVVFYILARRSAPVVLPSDFLSARQEAAEVSAKIVSLTTATNEKIKSVNTSDLSGNAEAAYTLIKEARSENSDAYNEAFLLSKNIQVMAASLNQLTSLKSQRLAYEAISVELALVSEFINYTRNLNDFLDALGRALATNSFADRRAVKNRLEAVNGSVNIINSLNREFTAKIGEFDKSF